jgi:hypothetical protein
MYLRKLNLAFKIYNELFDWKIHFLLLKTGQQCITWEKNVLLRNNYSTTFKGVLRNFVCFS